MTCLHFHTDTQTNKGTIHTYPAWLKTVSVFARLLLASRFLPGHRYRQCHPVEEHLQKLPEHRTHYQTMSAAGVVQSQIQFHIKLLCSISWIEAHALTYYIGCEPMWACNITTWPLEELHPVLALKWQKPLKNSEVCEENWDAIFLLPPYMLQPSLRATCPSIRARHLQFFFRCWSIAATSSSSSGFANEGICRGVLLGWNPLLLQCWQMP